MIQNKYSSAPLQLYKNIIKVRQYYIISLLYTELIIFRKFAITYNGNVFKTTFKIKLLFPVLIIDKRQV
jgi:hypothetical protein